jgi:hypothetical protein
MYLFEASYINLETGKETIKPIGFNGDVLFNSERECYLYAMGRAYDLMDEKEMFTTLEFVSC